MEATTARTVRYHAEDRPVRHLIAGHDRFRFDDEYPLVISLRELPKDQHMGGFFQVDLEGRAPLYLLPNTTVTAWVREEPEPTPTQAGFADLVRGYTPERLLEAYAHALRVNTYGSHDADLAILKDELLARMGA